MKIFPNKIENEKVKFPQRKEGRKKYINMKGKKEQVEVEFD